jgi:glyoxylase I family protein
VTGADGSLPGLRGLDHVGLTVPDLDQAVAYFSEVFGAVEVLRHPGYAPRPETNRRNFDRDERVEVVGIAVLRLGGTNLELLQYRTPEPPGAWPATSSAGGHHVAFYVDDLDATCRALRDRGIEVLGDPLPFGGAEAGEQARFVYTRAPWGLFVELVTYPHGKAYEAVTNLRLAPPR